MTSKRTANPMVLLGIATFAVLAVLIAIGMAAGVGGGGQSGAHTVTAVFEDAKQLHENDQVRINGVEIGKVTDITLDPDGPSAAVTMSLNDSAGPIYTDATASLRFRLALGGSFIVDLDRGTPSTGSLKGQIPLSQTESQVEVEDVTSVDQGAAESGLKTLPGELADALKDDRAPAKALETLAATSPDIGKGVGALRGSNMDYDLRQLVDSTAKTVDVLNTPDRQLQSLTSGASATLRTLGGRQGDIEAALAMSPGLMDRTNRTLYQLDSTLNLADGLVNRLRGPADEVRPTVAHLRPTLVDADNLADDAEPLLQSLRPSVRSVATTARGGLPLLRNLVPSLRRVDKTILPFMSEIDPDTQHSMSEMIGPTFAGVGGASAQKDNQGHFIRFPATSGNSPVYLPCQIYAGNPDKKELVACNSIENAFDKLFSYSPLGKTKGVQP
jgi:phospholipid/cholesterol/gamma-HCH transport system substrate-binding protein